uniref:Aminotransferase-like plant mobile domain-containing protein n=1 Tax=Fagus sylvatica TaxID=28930 RepID=A0A2N9HQI6_FAGSY
MLAVPLVFDFQCSRVIEWADWIDSELADREFCDHLEQAGVLRSILISRCSNMYRDTEALRQLVRKWCPSSHTFFFAHGELTVTLEDVENHWLLPILGDQGPAELELSPEESRIEAALADYIGRKNIALGTQAARFNSWMEHFNRVDDASIRRAAFVVYWLNKCIFGEHPAYSIKPLYFPLAVKIAAGTCFPLAPLLLGQLYTQLDMLHAKELVGASCHIVTTALNSSIVHTFLWEHALKDVPAVYRWVGNKFYDHGLVPSLDSESKICWRPYGVSHRRFVYESVMSGVLQYKSSRLHPYCWRYGVSDLSFCHQRWFVATSEIPTINPFLRARAFAYWSGIAPRVIVPSGDRIGVYTTGMSNYWRGLMATMVEFRNSGRGDISHLLESYTSPLPISHLLESYTSPLPHPRLFVATNTMTTYADRQMPSSRGKKTASAGTPAVKRKQPGRSKKREAPSKDSPAQASKKKKTSATKGGKEVLVLKTAVTSPPLAGEDIAQGVSAPSKQSADTSSLVLIEIPDDLDSSSSSSDPSGAAAEEIEREDAETGAAETVSDADDFSADISSIDTGAASGTSSGEKNVETRTSTEDDEVSMGELEAAEASSDSTLVASASRPISTEEAVEEHATVGVVTRAERVVETTPIVITSSGGTVQGGPFGSGSRVDPSLLDSTTVKVPTPPSPLPESGGTAPTPITTAAEASAAATVQEGEVVPTAIKEIPVGVTQIEHAEVAASEDPVQADVIPGKDHVAGAQAADMGVTAPVTSSCKPNRNSCCPPFDVVGELHGHGLIPICCPPSDEPGLMPSCCSPSRPNWLNSMDMAGSGNEAVAEEERRHQTVAVESAIRGQPGLLSAARSATLGSSVLTDMDAFFREFDRMSFSSRHAEHFWTFDDVKADFEIFRVPRGGIRFLKALWEKYSSCSSYFRLGVHVGSSLLTLLCCVLAHMEHTRLEDITEVHILEWKAVVQEAIEGGSWLNLRAAEARVAALRDALNMVAPNPWDLASARRVSAESHAESALHGLLA